MKLLKKLHFISCYTLFFILSFILSFIVFHTIICTADEYTFTGRAYNNDGELLYTEEHRVELKNNKMQKTHTDYTSPSGKLIATFNSDYTLYDYVPLYTFSDIRGQKEDGIYREGNRLILYRIVRGQKETKPLFYESDMVAGQALSYFVIDHLDELKEKQNKEYHIAFVIPDRLTTFDFRIRKIEKESQNENIVTIRIESDSWFFRLFVTYIEADYDTVNKRLVKYWGPSNLNDDKGDAQKVYIQYEY